MYRGHSQQYLVPLSSAYTSSRSLERGQHLFLKWDFRTFTSYTHGVVYLFEFINKTLGTIPQFQRNTLMSENKAISGRTLSYYILQMSIIPSTYLFNENVLPRVLQCSNNLQKNVGLNYSFPWHQRFLYVGNLWGMIVHLFKSLLAIWRYSFPLHLWSMKIWEYSPEHSTGSWLQ